MVTILESINQKNALNGTFYYFHNDYSIYKSTLLNDLSNLISSFTDRILFQAYPTNVQSNLFVYKYSSIDKIRDSDHSPVYGAVSLRIGPNSAKGHIFKKVGKEVI